MTTQITEIIDRNEFPSFGECIYCGASADETELTDEHIIPLSLGGNATIRKASCRRCAVETTRIEQEIGRKVLWDFRTHANVATRRPKERPTELSYTASIDDGDPFTKTVQIADHPFFTPMPAWGLPGLLIDEQPKTEFTHYKAHVFYWIPPNIRRSLGVEKNQKLNITIPTFDIDSHKFARAIAKIAYCQTIIKHGLHGFRRLVLPDLILGRYQCVPHFVGCAITEPPPPSDKSVRHRIQICSERKGNLSLIVTTVRLFANSGTEEHGPPIYEVVVGALPSSEYKPIKRPFRKYRSEATPKIIMAQC